MWNIAFDIARVGGLKISRTCMLQDRRPPLLRKIAKWKTEAHLLKCKKIFYITVDISSFSAYNKSEKIEGGHHNEV